MKIFFKRICVLVMAAIALSAMLACGDNDKSKAIAKSSLIGTFTYQETLGASREDAIYITHNAAIADGNRNRILASVYPLNNGMEDYNINRVSYNIDQRLRLKRDFSYEYEYSVLLGNPNDWGGRIGQLTVNISGAFTFENISDKLFSVELSDPVRGTQTLRSFRFASAGVYGLNIHDEDDLVLDYSYLSTLDGYKFDVYASGRTVTVNKEENRLSDDVFFPELLDYLASYCTY